MPILQTVFAIIAISTLALGDGPQDAWKSPSLPDLSTSFDQGNTHTILWSSDLSVMIEKYCSDCDPENVDLWLTGAGDSASTQKLLFTSMNVVKTKSFKWKVDIDTSGMTQWVFRFTPSGSAWVGGSGQELSSPIFKIDRDSSKPSTSQSPIATSVDIPIAPSANVPSTRPPSSRPTSGVSSSTPITPMATSGAPKENTPPKSGGADSRLATWKIGVIAAASVVGVLGLLIVAACLYRRRKARASGWINANSHQPSSSVHLSPLSGVTTLPTQPFVATRNKTPQYAANHHRSSPHASQQEPRGYQGEQHHHSTAHAKISTASRGPMVQKPNAARHPQGQHATSEGMVEQYRHSIERAENSTASLVPTRHRSGTARSPHDYRTTRAGISVQQPRGEGIVVEQQTTDRGMARSPSPGSQSGGSMNAAPHKKRWTMFDDGSFETVVGALMKK